MMPRRRRPTLDQRDTFIAKLIEFRGDLTPAEQQILDGMAVAAFCRRPSVARRGYEGVTAADLDPAADDTPWMAAFDDLGPRA